MPNKYISILIIFGIYIIFFDGNSLIKRYKTKQQIHALEQELEKYELRITNDQSEIEALKSNREKLEYFAREQYNMKKNDEDVFIIKE